MEGFPAIPYHLDGVLPEELAVWRVFGSSTLPCHNLVVDGADILE